MFTFKSPVVPENIWKICFKKEEEMSKIYYENRKQKKKKE